MKSCRGEYVSTPHANAHPDAFIPSCNVRFPVLRVSLPMNPFVATQMG